MRLALAALLLAPALAGATEVSGHLGLSYSRTDTWIERATRQAMPRLDLDLGAEASGVVVSREYLAWQLDAAWRYVSQEVERQRSSMSNSLYFAGRAALFSSQRSPVNLSVDAARNHTTFSASASSDVTGETVQQSYGTQAVLHAEGLPTLSLGYRWNGFDTSIPGLDDHHRTLQQLNAATYVGASVFRATASYLGELSDGTWTTDRYDTHRLGLTARAPLTPSTELFFDEQYLVTTPRSLADPGAQRLANNFFRAYLNNGGNFGDRQVVSYGSGRLLSEPAGGVSTESARQSIHYEGDLLLTSPTLFTRWIADASINQVRAGTAALDTTGETIGLQLWWRRPRAESLYELWAGPTFGFIQSNAGGDSSGWGASAQARANQPWLGQDTALSYRIDWAQDLFGAVGKSLRQSLSASLAGGLLDGRYVTTLSAGSSRTTSPILGDGASRSVSLFFNGTFRELVLEANAAVQQGIEGATPKDFTSDGLFLPAPWDARTLETWGRATYALLPGLSLTGQVRWLDSTHPGRPTIDQTEVLGSVQYRYGAFVVALEDRYGWNDVATGSFQVNQFMFRLYRQIAWGR
jgi:hypothetical protein